MSGVTYVPLAQVGGVVEVVKGLEQLVDIVLHICLSSLNIVC